MGIFSFKYDTVVENILNNIVIFFEIHPRVKKC